MRIFQRIVRIGAKIFGNDAEDVSRHLVAVEQDQVAAEHGQQQARARIRRVEELPTFMENAN